MNQSATDICHPYGVEWYLRIFAIHGAKTNKKIRPPLYVFYKIIKRNAPGV